MSKFESLLNQISEVIKINEKFKLNIATKKIDSLGDKVLYQLNNRIEVNLKAVYLLWVENIKNPGSKFSTGLLLRTMCTDIITFKYLAQKENENLLEEELKVLHREYLKTTLEFIKESISLFEEIIPPEYLDELLNEKQNIIKNDKIFFNEDETLKKVSELCGDSNRENRMVSENYKIQYIKNQYINIIRYQYPLSRSLYYFNKFHHYSLASQELAKDDGKYFDSFYWIVFESVMVLRLTILRFFEELHPLALRATKLENDIKPDFLK